LSFKEFNNNTFLDIKLKSLLEQTEKNEQYWVNVAEILGMHKEKLEKNGDDVYDRIKDLLDMAVQRAHLYNALIEELGIIKHGRR
tara:strand:+ start:1048 stop:1302 length:255 start_codon:yes stop_codon:yes gene_type:complete